MLVMKTAIKAITTAAKPKHEQKNVSVQQVDGSGR